jgi:hypothetical protein
MLSRVSCLFDELEAPRLLLVVQAFNESLTSRIGIFASLDS